MTRKELIEANREFRLKDESHKWPIRDKFNVTERAILHIRRAVQMGLTIESIEHYKQLIDQECSLIVNDQRNW